MSLPFVPCTKQEYSATSIKTFQNCRLQFYYDKMLDPRIKTKTTIELVLGSFMHGKIENFYKPDGTPKNKTAEAFTNCSIGQWKRLIGKGTYRGRAIDFRNLDGEEEKGIGYSKEFDIKQMCPKIYERYSVSPPPTRIEEEIHLGILHDGLIYRMVAKLDEIRDGLIIRDHKSDKGKPPRLDSSSLNHDIQFTIYAAAVSFQCMASKDPVFLEKMGVTKEDLEALVEDPLHLMERIKIEHHHLRTGRLTPTYRRKTDFYDIIDYMKEIEQFKKDIGSSEQALSMLKLKTPRRKERCRWCLYGDHCERDYEKERVCAPKRDFEIVSVSEGKPKKKKDVDQIKLQRRTSKGETRFVVVQPKPRGQIALL